MGSTLVTMVLMTSFVVSSPISGRVCHDRKLSGSASSFPGLYFFSIQNLLLAHIHNPLFFAERQLAVALLNRGSNGLYAVKTVNFGSTNSYMLNWSFAHLT